MTPTTALEAKGLFATLFDFGFTSFLTLKFLRLIYTVLTVAVLVFGGAFMLLMLSRGGVGIVFGLIIVPLVVFIYLLILRISMESVALFFRIGENTSLIASRLASPSGPAAYPQMPAQGGGSA
jgi:hypothetical protein